MNHWNGARVHGQKPHLLASARLEKLFLRQRSAKLHHKDAGDPRRRVEEDDHWIGEQT